MLNEPASLPGLTAGLLRASAYVPVHSRIVPAATALPKIFAGMVNQLAE